MQAYRVLGSTIGWHEQQVSAAGALLCVLVCARRGAHVRFWQT